MMECHWPDDMCGEVAVECTVVSFPFTGGVSQRALAEYAAKWATSKACNEACQWRPETPHVIWCYDYYIKGSGGVASHLSDVSCNQVTAIVAKVLLP